MNNKLVFKQEIDTTKIINGLGTMSICDLGKDDRGGVEVINQRDWKVPKFTKSTSQLLCRAFNCDNKCEQCVVTRIMEES